MAFPVVGAPSCLSPLFKSDEGRVRGYRAKVKIEFSKGSFLVKTLDRWEELEEVLRLRHAIFHTEHHGRVLPHGLDVDELDFVCDHLAIVDQARGKIVGAYRLTSTHYSNTFYASRRFQLGRFLTVPGNKLELGRACVERDYRCGPTLQLLWRGISEYLRATDTQYLFGSASARTTDPTEMARLYRYLRESGHVANDFGIVTHAEYRAPIADSDALEEPYDAKAAKALVPPLLQSYLRAGAKICAEPAIDHYLGSLDFLTILKIEAMADRYERRFASKGSVTE
jgi:putative hemolysin